MNKNKRGRPKTVTDPMIKRKVVLVNNSLKNKIEELAEKYNKSEGEVIRLAIEMLYKELKENAENIL